MKKFFALLTMFTLSLSLALSPLAGEGEPSQEAAPQEQPREGQPPEGEDKHHKGERRRGPSQAERPSIVGELYLHEEDDLSSFDLRKVSELSGDADLQKAQENLPTTASLTMEPILQYEELPTGCESVAMTMALNSLGFSLSKTEFAQKHLLYSDDNYALGYVGDPFSDYGAGIFPPGLVMSANQFLKEQESSYRAYDATGLSLEELLPYLASQSPLLIWVTMYFDAPDFSGESVEFKGISYPWYSNEHCVAVQGYDLTSDTIYLMDPLQGSLQMSLSSLSSLYEEIGSFAVLLR